MTSVVGLIHNGIAYLASDSLLVDLPGRYHSDASQSRKKEPKVFRKGEILFGASGSVRMAQMLHYEFELPPYSPGTSKMRWIVADFIKAFQAFLKLRDYDIDGGLGGNILLAWEQDLFRIANDWGTDNPVDPFYAIGTTDQVAYGSLHTTNQLGLPPLERLRLALGATEYHTCAVSPPFMFISSEMDEPDLLS